MYDNLADDNYNIAIRAKEIRMDAAMAKLKHSQRPGAQTEDSSKPEETDAGRKNMLNAQDDYAYINKRMKEIATEEGRGAATQSGGSLTPPPQQPDTKTASGGDCKRCAHQPGWVYHAGANDYVECPECGDPHGFAPPEYLD